MKKNRITLLFLTLFLGSSPGFSQYIPVHPTSQIYDFLTELSNDQSIDAPTFSKPFGRKEVAEYLSSLDPQNLNPRQHKELVFYLKDFNKDIPDSLNFIKRMDLLYYKDKLFRLTLNPILGGNYWLNENGGAYHLWNGAEAWASLGKWGFWGSLRDNHESQVLTQPDFMNQNYGGANFKVFSDGQVDYWEVRAGISYDFGIGHIAIMKDHFSWGSNYHGANILSGRTPSVPQINLKIKPVEWFEFQYIHAFLTSEVIDSLRSFNVSNAYGTDFREVYHAKFMAANLFTFRPFKRLDISFGNSIIYDYDNPHIAYFIPIMFYKAMDHQLSSGINNMNSQIFLDISARPLKHLHLYSTLFLDELAAKRITDPDDYNFYSFKAGFHVSNLIPDFYAGLEYTITNSLTFRHFVPTLTFESNRFNLGHYLEDNSKEIYFNIGYKPIRNLDVRFSYCRAQKGPDHTLLGSMPRMKQTPFTPIVWESDEIGFRANWQIINDVYLNAAFLARNIRGEQSYLDMWTPEYYHGKTNTVQFGINISY